MAVFRVEKTKDFTIMCNHHLRNTELSLKAKWLLSLKMNYNIRKDTACDRSTGIRVPKAWYVTWNLYLNTAKMDSIFVLPGRITNAIRIKPLHTSTWLAAKKRMRIYSRRFSRRFRNSTNSTSWYIRINIKFLEIIK